MTDVAANNDGIDAFAEAERLVDEFGPRPPGSDAERRAAKHLVGRLHDVGREAEVEAFAVWPAWATGYAINAGVAVVGSVLSVSNGTVGTIVVLLATILTFLDLSGIAPTTRRLLGRRASQNVVSWGDRDKPGALLLVAHYDSGPTRTRPLRPLFIAMLVLLACCVLRAAGMSGTALTLVQFIPTAALIVYVALLLDVVLSPAAPGENDNASGVAVVLRAAERLSGQDELGYFGVHVLFTGSQKAMAQGMRAFLKAHRLELKEGDVAVVNVDAVGSGELRLAKKEGPLLGAKSHPQLLGLIDVDTFVNPEPSDGYAAASAGIAATTVNADGTRLEEEALGEAEELVVELAERLDEELSQP
jgi:Peptidase family M28